MNNVKTKPDWDYLPLITALSSNQKEGYRPTDIINDFWNKYTCQDAVSHVFEIYLRMKGKKNNLQATVEELDSYIRDLMNAIVAYYLFHLGDFENGEVVIDIEKSCPSEFIPEPPKGDYEMILKSLFGFF